MACIRFSTQIFLIFFFLDELMLGVIVIPCTCYQFAHLVISRSLSNTEGNAKIDMVHL